MPQQQFSPKPKECSNCALETIGQGFIQPEGTGSIPLLIVGESPGFNEIIDSLPFRPNAQAGSILHRVIQEKAKGTRNSYVFWNMIGCRPPGDFLNKASYEYEAINHCRVHFDKIINKYKPKVILATGALPFKHLTGLEGEKLGITNVRGYVFQSSRYPDILVVPTLHPSYIRRGNANLMPVLLFDFIKAQNIALGKGINHILDPLNSQETFLYKTSPTIGDAISFLNTIKFNPSLLIAYDIETKESIGKEEDELEEYGKEITQIQFSIAKNTGIAFPWQEPFISISRSILATNNPKVGWNNWDFDDPILRDKGMEINGRIDDGMWMWHHWQADMPRGLQFVSSFYNFPYPWKHLAGLNLSFYGVADVDSLHYIYEPLVNQLKERDLWRGYERYVRELKPVLGRISSRGIPINIEKRDKFKEEIDLRHKEIAEELKELIPEELNGIHPAKGYKNLPAPIRMKILKFQVENGIPVTEISDRVAKGVGLVLREFEEDIKFDDVVVGSKKVKRYCKEVFFNPNSPDQVSDYIKLQGDDILAKKLAIKMSKESRIEEVDGGGEGIKKKKDNVTTSKEVIVGLLEKTGNKVYGLIKEEKELTKMGGTYIDGYVLGPDNRVHTIYGFHPASQQLNSRKPNVQNYPVHTRLAERFKEIIEARPGYKLASFDYRGFHNKMMGFLAEDEVYLRLAGLDTHSYLTGYVVKWPGMDQCMQLDDEKLLKFLKEIKNAHKKLRDDQVKHVVHGINFGLSEKGCYDRYKVDFNPQPQWMLDNWGRRKKSPNTINAKTGMTFLHEEIEREGKKNVRGLYDIVRRLFPKVFKWQERTIVDADKGWLDTPFGFRRWFPAASEVKYDRKGNVLSRVKGEQAEEGLAYPVSSNSHVHMRGSILELEDKGINEEGNLINTIHDSLVFEIEEKKLEKLGKEIIKIMERRSDILKNKVMPEGFWCKVDVKVGTNMQNAEEVTL